MAIDIKNKNEKLELSYSDLNMKLVSENIELGRNVIPSFSQEPGNTTSLNVTLNVDRDSIDRDSISLLEDDRKKAQVVVKITMVGSVGFHLGIFKLNKVPIHVTCNFQQYLLLYRVKEPPCSITMFPTSLINNRHLWLSSALFDTTLSASYWKLHQSMKRKP
ncbi:uncharacterized protein LOC111788445 [Cucurbita pepo subsp. pepo]|uniref:uncharacterized protein LOC111784941 n=1 Tax=Cucurbita pepo subsp. pepo TaxID=3664 RepID=UPI000C9D66C5|nr:uncharacterized protein LOC111784941 [Cucurbita pepo subsp. pepo]XP_023524547.1 uncharacterized protein LOC111788445 [Cucurbita pepo subsp. pepo]